MPTFRGQISRDGRVILPSVAGAYFPFTGRRRGRATWSGAFDSVQGQVIDAGGSYRLTLDDGRSGEIVIDMMIVSSHNVTRVLFRGVSPLQGSIPAEGTDE